MSHHSAAWPGRSASAIWPIVAIVMLVAACAGPARQNPAAVTAAATPAPSPPPSPLSTATVPEASAGSPTAANPAASPSVPGSSSPTAVPATPSPLPTAATMESATPTVAATTAASPTPTAAVAPKPTIGAAPFDPGRVHIRAERVGVAFDQPLYVTHAGDGSGRVFVAEKIGRVRLLDGTVILDITDRVTSPPVNSYEREQGLIGLAFHPRFAQNGNFYVHYNDRQGNHVVSRFTVGPDGRSDPSSETVLLTEHQPETNFSGGQLLFQDGYLYVGFGTGGAAVELQANAVDLGSLLGKILRIDVDHGDPYAIPPDNPFVGRAGARPEIWAYGLRNPYRFSFDRATGDLFVATPGQFSREWISYQPGGTPGGRHFGWPVIEGSLCWNAETCDRSGLEPPILEYTTYEGGTCAVIGGYVYRGARIPELDGVYVFGDFCSGRVWGGARDADGRWVRHDLTRVGGLISSFGEDEAGELYVTDISNGVVYQLSSANPD